MEKLIKITLLVINLLFPLVLPAQEALMENSKKGNLYSKIVHSVAFEFNNVWYFKGKMTEHPYPNLGYETRTTYGTEWLLKYNLTFKSGVGISLETVKGTCNYEFSNRINGDKHLTHWGFTPLGYFFDILTLDRLGFNIKASYRYPINDWLSILPEIGIQMLYYKPSRTRFTTLQNYENLDSTWSEILIQYMEYENFSFKRKFSPDLSASFNFLFHKKDDPRHNFTVGLNTNLCFGIRYFGAYSVTPPFQSADCLFYLTSSYIGLRFGYSYSSFPKPIRKTKPYRQNELYATFDLQNPIHSIGLLFSGGNSIQHKFKNTKGLHPFLDRSFVPESFFKYSFTIKNGWGITAEIPFGVFQRSVRHNLNLIIWNIPEDTVWSNGVVGSGHENLRDIKTYYLGISLKASYLANIHKNISLQSEAGVKWLPFIIPAKQWEIDEPFGEFVISDGTETEKLVYMNCMPVISAASYAVPDLAFSFNVLVHGKNPANNFVFGINGNISLMDRVHFKYQTTDVLPEHLQSSGEFGWRMSSIGFHIGYQWMTGKKKVVIKQFEG